MEELIKATWELRQKCRCYGERVNQLLGSSDDSRDPRHACFPMIFNTSTMYFELLSYYCDIWDKLPTKLTSEEVERGKQENAGG